MSINAIYLIFTILYLVSPPVKAANDGQCNFTESWIGWDFPYVHRELVYDIGDFALETFSDQPITLLETKGDFMTLSITDTNGLISLKVHSNENFRDIDLKTGTTIEDVTAISSEFVLLCKNGNSTMQYAVVIKDTNNHEPVFEQTIYNYKLPRNIAPTQAISSYGQEIIVTDLDFSNQNVDFIIEPEGVFNVKTEVLGNKTYKAVITVQNLTNLDSLQSYKLTAIDSDPIARRTSSVHITIGMSSAAATSLEMIILFILMLFNFIRL